jgi:hypothetical protein
MNESIKIMGNVKLTHFDKDRNILSIDEGKNMVVNKGKEFIAKIINGVSTNAFKYIEVGTGATAPAEGNTALQTPVTSPSGMAIQLATCEYVTDYKARLSATFTNNGGASISLTESGVFDANSSGNMLCRKTFGSKTLNVGESLLIQWTITVSSS